MNVLSSNDLFNHINTLIEILTEGEQVHSSFIPSLHLRSMMSIVDRSLKYLEDESAEGRACSRIHRPDTPSAQEAIERLNLPSSLLQ
jgi:hypothetical protein